MRDFINENKVIADTLKKNEEIMRDYLNELQQGLSEQTLTFDKIEKLMLDTMLKVKSNAVEACSKMLSDESKKKLLLELAKNVEELKSSHLNVVTSK